MSNSLKPLLTGLDTSPLAPQETIKPEREWWSDAVDAVLPVISDLTGIERDPQSNQTGAIGAYTHYIGGSGVSQQVDASRLDFSNVDPMAFEGVRDVVLNASPGTYSVEPSTENIVPQTGDKLFVGRVRGTLEDGSVTVHQDGTYDVTGRIAVADERFDFDLNSPGRSRLGEFTTWMGATLADLVPGANPEPFETNFVGSAPYEASGKLPAYAQADTAGE